MIQKSPLVSFFSLSLCYAYPTVFGVLFSLSFVLKCTVIDLYMNVFLILCWYLEQKKKEESYVHACTSRTINFCRPYVFANVHERCTRIYYMQVIMKSKFLLKGICSIIHLEDNCLKIKKRTFLSSQMDFIRRQERTAQSVSHCTVCIN